MPQRTVGVQRLRRRKRLQGAGPGRGRGGAPDRQEPVQSFRHPAGECAVCFLG